MNKCTAVLEIIIRSGSDEFWEEVISEGKYSLVVEEVERTFEELGYDVNVKMTCFLLGD